MNLDRIKKTIVVKTLFKKMGLYYNWTEVSPFLACGLVGVKRKYKIELSDI